MTAEEFVGTRFDKPVERLTSSYFDPDDRFRGLCMYCHNDFGNPGIVFIWRNQATMKLQPDRCGCVLCGQQYYVEYEDLEALFGFHPSLEGIEEYAYRKETARWRSIDAEFKPSLD
jgi:hypothetical protein